MAKNNPLVNSSQIDRLIFHAKDANGIENLQNKVISAATAFSIKIDLNGATEIEFFISELAGVNAIATFNLTAKYYEADGSLITLSTQTVVVPQTTAGANQYVTVTGSTFISKAAYCIITGTLPFTLAYTCSIFAKTLNVIDISGSITETNSGDILSASQTMVTTTADILSALTTLNSANYIDGAAFTVSASQTLSTGSIVNPTDKLADGVIGAEAMNEYREKKNAGYDSSADAQRVTDINPKNGKRVPLNNFMTFAASAVAQTLYIDMAIHDHLTFQFSLTVGLLTITFAGALLDDGTADSSCTYADITDDVVGAATYVVDATVAPVYQTLADVAGIFGEYKYIRVIATPTGASTGIIHARKKVI